MKRDDITVFSDDFIKKPKNYYWVIVEDLKKFNAPDGFLDFGHYPEGKTVFQRVGQNEISEDQKNPGKDEEKDDFPFYIKPKFMCPEFRTCTFQRTAKISPCCNTKSGEDQDNTEKVDIRDNRKRFYLMPCVGTEKASLERNSEGKIKTNDIFVVLSNKDDKFYLADMEGITYDFTDEPGYFKKRNFGLTTIGGKKRKTKKSKKTKRKTTKRKSRKSKR